MKQLFRSCYHLQMKIFHTENHVLHHCQGEMKDGVMRPCYEHPGRADNVFEALHQAGHTDLQTPDDFGMQPLMAVHKSDYLAFLQTVWNDWAAAGRTGDIFPLVWPGRRMRRNVQPEGIDGRIGLYAFDSGSPMCAGTWQVTYESAQCALSAAQHIRQGDDRMAFSFTRPPGHHAMAGQYGGYCFINHAAVAAQYLREDGLNRVAILDVDYHHGNGSQSIFYDRPDVLVVNIHCDPKVEYPYYLGHANETGTDEGVGYNLNLPLPRGTDWTGYQPALAMAIERVSDYGADALVLSFGADSYIDDPLGSFRLVRDDFTRIGQAINGLGLRTMIVLEGGYATEALGSNVCALLDGIS